MADTTASPYAVTAHTTKRQFRTYNLLVILAMAFGSVAMGYSGSIIGTTLAQPTFVSYFELETRPNATSLLSAMNGLFQAGAFFGALCISWVADRYGRKMSITVAALLVIFSGALLAGSAHIAMFLTFRFFAGMGSFWLLGAIPVWMTEIVPPRNRGLLVDIHSASLLFGYTWAAWMGFAFYHLSSKNAWRAPLALQCLPALIVAFAQLFLDGTQYVYFAELFPQHLRAKGMTIGMAAISLMNVMWLQAAPTAFKNISWKFYLCFIIPAYLFAIVCLLFYPNTKGLALEEIAAIFGDEVQADVFLANNNNVGGVDAVHIDKESQLTGSSPEHVENTQ
ncbi:General substrate transporter [Niveomyces insectorum RCEF 264]|uniref:General substrate transporter n=1 Tax=Niveomyces insectorum RCEF 264 TaxID=1081102 RepID=A0A167T3R3_9HYPO|nr:General substrate transporter [Niveomyces insectorum RCEF 264]